MYRNIFMPIDQSRTAEAALPFATALTRELGARLALIWVGWPSGRPTLDSDAQMSAVETAETYLRDVAMRLSDHGIGVDVIVPYDPPLPAILSEIAVRRPDLVIIPIGTTDAAEASIFGRLAEEILMRSPVPILFVPEAEGVRQIARRGQRIVIPLDGSPSAEEALPHAVRLARELRATLNVLQVVSPVPEAVAGTLLEHGVVEPERTKAKTYLRKITDRLAEEGISAQNTIQAGEPATVIREAGQAEDVSLVVITNYGWEGPTHGSYGKVANQIVRKFEAPLLVVRPYAMPGVMLPEESDRPTAS